MGAWLADPAQDGHSGLFKRYGAGFFEGEGGNYSGWVYVGHAGSTVDSWTWVAGGQAGHVAVMRIPGSLERAAAIKRFREAAVQVQLP